MPVCTYIGTCAMMRDEVGFSPEFARIMRETYCRAAFETCARYQLARMLGQDAVPEDLFPVEHARVRSFAS